MFVLNLQVFLFVQQIKQSKHRKQSKQRRQSKQSKASSLSLSLSLSPRLTQVGVGASTWSRETETRRPNTLPCQSTGGRFLFSVVIYLFVVWLQRWGLVCLSCGCVDPLVCCSCWCGYLSPICPRQSLAVGAHKSSASRPSFDLVGPCF